MESVLWLCSLLGSSVPTAGPISCAQSYLYQPSFCLDYELRGPVRPYCPQPGDIFLSTERDFAARFGHKLAHSGAPHHSGIVVARADGRMALLEGGPHRTLFIRIVDLNGNLAAYGEHNRIWIRPRCLPLTAEESCRLTAFAAAVDGKPFAVLRLLGQVTPLRCRGPFTASWCKSCAADFCADGSHQGLKNAYFCSELVTEACVAAGLFDPATTRPVATYPRDLFFGRSRNPYVDQHLDMSAWEPPARWTICPGCERDLKPRPWLDGDGAWHQRGW